MNFKDYFKKAVTGYRRRYAYPCLPPLSATYKKADENEFGDQYIEFSKKNSKTIIFKLENRGFYSEINNLLNCLAYGIIMQKRIIVDDHGFSNGDLQLLDFIQANNLELNSTPRVNDPSISTIEGCSSRKFWEIREFISGLHDKSFRTPAERLSGFVPSGLSIYELKRLLANHVLKFKQEDIAEHEITSDPYTALHIRRGDKINGYISSKKRFVAPESYYIPCEKYLTVARQKNNNHCNSYFIMSDDERVNKQVSSKLNPKTKESSFCLQSLMDNMSNGFDIEVFTSKLTKSQKLLEIRHMIKEIQVATNSDLFVGGYNGNVSRFIALMHKNPANCYSVDNRLKWSPG